MQPIRSNGAMLALDMGEQPLDEPILTPHGWVRMGDLRVGSQVIGSDGCPTTVTRIIPFGERPLWKVTLADGAEIHCSPTHLWTVRRLNGNWKWETVTTSEIRDSLSLHYNEHKNKLPRLSPVQFWNKSTVPLCPYILGILLSDGSFTRNTFKFTCCNAGILEEIQRRGFDVSSEKDGKHHLIRGLNPAPMLKSLGLYGCTSFTKFIPDKYLYAEDWQRLELLRGLMDGDGSHCNRSATYATVSHNLALGVSSLVRSLGGAGAVRHYPKQVKRNGEEKTLDVWNVVLGMPQDISPFLASGKCSGRKRNNLRRIISIEDTGQHVPMQCIQVSAADSLYVASGFALTHNCGKSRCAIDIINNYRFKRVLILCPRSVVNVWPEEFAKYGTEPYWICTLGRDAGTVQSKKHKAETELAKAVLAGRPFVGVCNYDSIWREPLAAWALRQDWDLIICDESHRIAAHNAKSSRYVSRLGAKSRQRLCLTGTPMSSSPLSVYGQYRFLDPSIFGTRWDEFRQRYAVTNAMFASKVDRYINQDELHNKFYSIAYRVESGDVLSLPDEQHIRRTVNLGSVARKAYKELEDEFYTQLEHGEITVQNALVKLLRLQQVTSGYAKRDGDGVEIRVDSAKEEALEDILADLAPDEPFVVFARFTHDLHVVQELCKKLKRGYSELSGRCDQLAEWQAGKTTVIGVNIQSGGAGISLVRSRYCCYYSQGFSLGNYSQSLKRVHRPGQTRPVTYFHLIAEKTVDEKVYAALSMKQDAVQAILSGRR